MARIVKELLIKNAQGLHARPAAMFVQIISKYDAEVVVVKDGERVNGKSIMGILSLGAQQNSAILLEVEGDDAQKVIEELEKLLSDEKL